MRAVCDPNVLISAALSPSGTPAQLMLRWQSGDFELLVSPLLLAELNRALAYPKLRKRVPPDQARELVSWLERTATLVLDPKRAPAVRSVDPGDDYLIALAQAQRAALVSGDKHLLALVDQLPVFGPAEFLSSL
ncbi:MAG: putative toxin-antitoxin system toxin component, PIN family [Gaiellaceae bacterium MAG52_C11]|nr:putative toxin-antitoxin system toxin component, PIN family [Candidatus Gaiellasilicea maunaloa]